MRGKRLLSAAALIMAAAVIFASAACSGVQQAEAGNTAEPTSAASVPTPTPAPTVVPYLLQLGKGGLLEDTYVKLYIPEYLEYDSSPEYNCAYYTAVTDKGESLAFAYLPDTETSYQKEIGGLKREDYVKQVYNSSGANVEEFKFVEVAGHEALRTLAVYTNSEGAKARTLTYFINVDGWLLTLSYTTSMQKLPAECEQGILDIVFKTDAD